MSVPRAAVKKTKQAKDPDGLYNVQVINRVLDILETLADKREGFRLTDLANEVKLPFSTTFRLVTLMARRDYVEHDPESRRYFLGLKLLQLRGQVLSRLELVDQATPVMRELMQETGEVVHLAILHEGHAVYVRSLEGPRSPFMSTPLGYRAPVHCTSLGKALLAHLTEKEVRAIVNERGLQAFTANTIVTVRRLLTELEETRARGYSVDDLEQYEGLRCVGAPVFGHFGKVIAAISIAAPSMRFSREKVEPFGRLLVTAASAISTRMGFVPENANLTGGQS